MLLLLLLTATTPVRGLELALSEQAIPASRVVNLRVDATAQDIELDARVERVRWNHCEYRHVTLWLGPVGDGGDDFRFAARFPDDDYDSGPSEPQAPVRVTLRSDPAPTEADCAHFFTLGLQSPTDAIFGNAVVRAANTMALRRDRAAGTQPLDRFAASLHSTHSRRAPLRSRFLCELADNATVWAIENHDAAGPQTGVVLHAGRNKDAFLTLAAGEARQVAVNETIPFAINHVVAHWLGVAWGDGTESFHREVLPAAPPRTRHRCYCDYNVACRAGVRRGQVASAGDLREGVDPDADRYMRVGGSDEVEFRSVVGTMESFPASMITVVFALLSVVVAGAGCYMFATSYTVLPETAGARAFRERVDDDDDVVYPEDQGEDPADIYLSSQQSVLNSNNPGSATTVFNDF